MWSKSTRIVSDRHTHFVIASYFCFHRSHWIPFFSVCLVAMCLEKMTKKKNNIEQITVNFQMKIARFGERKRKRDRQTEEEWFKKKSTVIWENRNEGFCERYHSGSTLHSSAIERTFLLCSPLISEIQLAVPLQLRSLFLQSDFLRFYRIYFSSLASILLSHPRCVCSTLWNDLRFSLFFFSLYSSWPFHLPLQTLLARWWCAVYVCN